MGECELIPLPPQGQRRGLQPGSCFSYLHLLSGHGFGVCQTDLGSNLNSTQLARGSRASHLTSIFLGFLTCKMGLITVLTSWNHVVTIN